METTKPKSIRRAMREYHTQGKNLLVEYRERSINDIPIAEWFKARIPDPEDYEFWANWRFRRFDVSDAYFDALPNEKKGAFIAQERERWKYGYWLDTPRFLRMDSEQRLYQRNLNPLYGKVQVLTGTQYLLLNYPASIGDTPMIPRYYRKSAQFLDIVECLDGYEREEGQNRIGLVVVKCKSVQFSVNTSAYLVRKMRINRGYNALYCMDVNLKNQIPIPVLMAIYTRSPNWFRERIKDPKTKQWKDTSPRPVLGTEVSKFILKLANEDRTDIDQTLVNTLYFTGSKPSNFEGKRIQDIFSDEAGLYETHPLHIHVRRVGIGCLLGPSRCREYLHVVGGTSDQQKKSASQEYEFMARNPGRDYCTFFMGVQHYMYTDPATGWPDEERKIREVKEVCAELRDRGDIKGLQAMRSEDATCLDDCFLGEGGTLSIDTEAVDEQLRNIRTIRQKHDDESQRIEVFRCKFRIPPGASMPVAEPSDDGNWYIIEHPSKRTQQHAQVSPDYVWGSDNVNLLLHKDANPQAKGLSQQAMVVLNSWTGLTAAYYEGRHTDPVKDFAQKLMGAMHYNAQGLIEANKDRELLYFMGECTNEEPFKSIAASHNNLQWFGRYVADTPNNYGYYSHAIRKGITTTTANRPTIFQYLLDFHKEDGGKYLKLCYFQGLLERIRSWKITDPEPPDLGMAKAIATLLFYEKRIVVNFQKRRISPQSLQRALQRETYKRSTNGVYLPSTIPQSNGIRSVA